MRWLKIIISPAKKMVEDCESIAAPTKPNLISEARKVGDFVRTLSFADQTALWGCNEKIAELNAERFRTMEFDNGKTPAILAYEGIQYQYMAPAVFEDGEFDYVQENVRILSALYGVLRPLDGISPYRLEMQAKAKVNGCKDLYEFWGEKLYKEILDESRIIINLASKEYSKCIEKFLQPEDRFITCVFGEKEITSQSDSNGCGDCRIVQKGVYAKMARGEMVRFLASVKAKSPEDLKAFNSLGYVFDKGLSTDDKYIFIKQSQVM